MWLDELRAHAERAWPHECVGALLVDAAGRGEVLALQNVAADPRRAFDVSARELLEVERRAQAQGVEVWGYYHSHPGHPAVPSAEDARSLTEGRGMLIVSVHDGRAGEVRGWALKNGQVAEVEVPAISR